MHYNLNHEWECKVVFAWNIRYYIGQLSEKELDTIFDGLNSNEIFWSLVFAVAELLKKRNETKSVQAFYTLSKEDKLNIISVITKQYEDYKWVSILW